MKILSKGVYIECINEFKKIKGFFEKYKDEIG